MTLPDDIIVHPHPDARLVGSVRVPGDKSISHRAFLLGALAEGPVTVRGAADSDDVRATVAALRSMGVTVAPERGGFVVDGAVGEPEDVLDCGNSGTAMRLLAGVCAGIRGLSVLTGDASLRGRPMDRVAEPLRRMGADVSGRASGRLAPLVVRGGDLRGIDYVSPVASAQVKSCVLLAGLGAAGTTRVREPAASRDHTERMLAWLGGDVTAGEGVAEVRASPLRPRPLDVPGDPSSAAFWAVAAAVLPGSRITLEGVCLNPTRVGAFEVLENMGARIVLRAEDEQCGEPVGQVEVVGGSLGSGTVDDGLVVRSIDELPVLAVAGALGGGLLVRNAGELRVKESDRIDAVASMLGAVGVPVETFADGFRVAGAHRPHGGVVDSGGDHRIAMSAAVAALAASGPVRVRGFGVVATSYPSFLADLERLGGRWEASSR